MHPAMRSDTRIADDAKLFERNERARRAIRLGLSRDDIMEVFELSETAFEQLAGQVRSGAGGNPPTQVRPTAPRSFPITPRRSVRPETPLEPIRDGKRWCQQCDKRVTLDTERACTSPFCSLRRGGGR